MTDVSDRIDTHMRNTWDGIEKNVFGPYDLMVYHPTYGHYTKNLDSMDEQIGFIITEWKECIEQHIKNG